MVHIKQPDPGLGPLDYERLRERVRLEISFLSVESLAEQGEMLIGLGNDMIALAKSDEAIRTMTIRQRVLRAARR